MYKRLLVATDGSDLSERAVDEAIALAKALGAEVVGVHAAPELQPYVTGVPDLVGPLQEDYRKACAEQAEVILERVEQAARKAGVPSEVHYLFGKPVYESILDAVQRHGCDLVVMGSHGRGSVGALVLGSETQKVLARTRVPTLVVR